MDRELLGRNGHDPGDDARAVDERDMRFTEREYRDYEAKRASKAFSQSPTEWGCCEQEAVLHEQILDYCQQQEWLVIHSRFDKRTTFTTPGVSDFVIIRHDAKPLIIEAKAKYRKPTPDQLAFIAHARKLGCIAGVVGSFEEFLQLVQKEQS